MSTMILMATFHDVNFNFLVSFSFVSLVFFGPFSARDTNTVHFGLRIEWIISIRVSPVCHSVSFVTATPTINSCGIKNSDVTPSDTIGVYLCNSNRQRTYEQ